MLFLTKGVTEMLKKMMVVLGCMGIMASANAEEGSTAARGQINLTSVIDEGAPPYVSVLKDLNGEEGYLTVVLDEEVLSELPRHRTNIGTGFTISQACSFVPAASYGSESQLVKVNRTNARYVNDDRVVITVQLLMGDGENQPSSLACTYSVSAQDIEQYGQDVFTIEYMNDKGHLSDEIFNFDIDTYLLMVDNSIAV